MDKEKSKKRAQDRLIVAIVGVSAGIAFVGGSAFSDGHNSLVSRNTTKKTNTNSEIVVAGYGSSLPTLGFDEYQIMYDENDYSYSYIFDSYAGLSDSYLEIRYGEDNNTINVVRNYLDTGATEGHLIEFDQKVVDSFVAGFGDSNDKDSIFFILEDGSIEYMLVNRAVKNDDYRTFKIEELKNIAKHYNANACSEVTTECKRTVLVQAMDGTIYDLIKYVQ